MNKLLTAALLSVLLAGSAFAGGMIFETIEKGTFCNQTLASKYVIKSQEDWQRLWENTKCEPIPPEGMDTPDVDFDRSMVVAVYMGVKMTSGYSVEIKSIYEEMGVVKVIVEWREPDPSAYILPVLTQPYHIVKVEKSDFEVHFFVEGEDTTVDVDDDTPIEVYE